MTPKQKKFAHEYLINGFNATKAAISAGYSKKTARSQGQRLLTNVDISEYVAQKKAKLIDKYEVTEDKLIREMAKIAFSDIKNYVNGGNIPLELKFLENDLTAAVQEVGVEEKEFKGVRTVNRKVKLYDKKSALETLMKFKGMFEKDNRQKAAITVGFADEDEE